MKEESYDKLNAVVTQFLGINMEYLGSVPQDSTVRKAVMKQKPVTIVYPNSLQPGILGI